MGWDELRLEAWAAEEAGSIPRGLDLAVSRPHPGNAAFGRTRDD